MQARKVSTHLEYARWDTSELQIVAERGALNAQLVVRKGRFSISQPNNTTSGTTSELSMQLVDPERSIQLWIANFLFSIVFGLGLLAVFDAALLKPAELARDRSRSQTWAGNTEP